ncbi:uncharacterized protein CLUP02_07323, partial [Colletotrichum lupini]
NSLTKFPLFFILKKGKKSKPIINYKKLNEIIKKNSPRRSNPLGLYYILRIKKN